VVVPAYNAERTVVDTVQSALAQTFTDLELLVVDDGSTDGTVGRLEAIRDPRLAVRSVSHAGLAATRNRGIAATRGALVAFLDADDLWTPDVDAAGHPVGAQRAVSLTGDVYAALLVENIAPSGSNLLVRRGALEDVGGFDPACQVSEDWELAVRLAARWPFVVVPRHQVFYRQTPGSMTAGLSASPERWAEAMRAVVDRVFAAVPPPLQGLKRRRLARVHLYIAHRSLLHAVDVGAVRRAGRQLREALRLDPALLLEPTARRVSARWFLTWGLGGRVACRLTAWARRRA
jgi:glycosyltransferase involved in cell wall biosynthesis